MRFKCLNQNCGRSVEMGQGQPPPKFCTACGSSLTPEGATELNLDQTAETVGETGTAVFRRLTEITTKTVEQTTSSTPKPKNINTGILSRLPVAGPPAAEPEDIPLFRVVTAPPNLLHDDEIPAGQDGSNSPARVDAQNVQSELIPEDGLAMAVEDGDVAPEEKSGLEDGAPDFEAYDNQLFAMLGAQLPSTARDRPGAGLDSSYSEFQTEDSSLSDSSPSPDMPIEEEFNRPVSEPADATSDTPVEFLDGEDAELMRMLQDQPIEKPERALEPSVPAETKEIEFANAAALLGKFEPAVGAQGKEILQVFLESLGYSLRGSGTHLLVFSVLLWLVTVAVVMKVSPYAAAPIMLIQLVLVACTGLTSLLLGSKGQKASLQWPVTTMEGWGAIVRCLLRFAPMDLLIAGLALISGYLAKGYVLLVPILMMTSSMIICLDSKWKNVFSPNRHLRLLAASPMALLKMLVLGCGLGILAPVLLGMVISISIGAAMHFWMLKLAFWFCLSGPIGWIAGTAGGYGIGLLYSANTDQFDESAPPKGFEGTLAAGLFGICLLLSFVF